MKDVYVLRFMTNPYTVMAVADDFDRASMEMARYPREVQRNLVIENHDLLEEGD
jgi:hypothetical protein